MNASEQKIVQYLHDARVSEVALVRVLQSHIAITPRGSYRASLEAHLKQTRDHAARVGGRLEALDEESRPLAAIVGFWEDFLGHAFALGKAPFDLFRGSGGEEKVLENAKNECAAEALEIATYTAIERLARSVGDEETAVMAASILADEKRMLDRVMREIPKLTDAVVRADIKSEPSYDAASTGAGDAIREARADVASRATAASKRTAREARKAPGIARTESQIKAVVTSESDLAIGRYDALATEEITGSLAFVSQIDLGKIDAYERKHQNRSAILRQIRTLRWNEPWAGYDALTAAEVEAEISSAGDGDRARQARSYERAHKNRPGVINAATRELAKT